MKVNYFCLSTEIKRIHRIRQIDVPELVIVIVKNHMMWQGTDIELSKIELGYVFQKGIQERTITAIAREIKKSRWYVSDCIRLSMLSHDEQIPKLIKGK